MPKSTFYFSHDFHARKDPKCMALINEFGAEGYGIYWCLIEIIYEQGGKIRKFPALYSGLAFEFHVTEEALTKQIEAMLHRFELLLQDENFLWSASVLNRLNLREAKRSTKSESGRKGGLKSGESRRLQSKRSNASSKGIYFEANEAKERKVKERKEIKGEKFNEEKNAVIFTDGSLQKLGDMQLFRIEQGDLQPEQVLKGIIN